MRTNYPTHEIGRQIDYERIKRSAFEHQRVLVAKIDDPRLDQFERQFLQNVGQKLYGQRRAHG